MSLVRYSKIELDVLFQVVQDFTVERFLIASKRLIARKRIIFLPLLKSAKSKGN